MGYFPSDASHTDIVISLSSDSSFLPPSVFSTIVSSVSSSAVLLSPRLGTDGGGFGVKAATFEVDSSAGLLLTQTVAQ